MELQEIFDNARAAERVSRNGLKDQLTLGELLILLNNIPDKSKEVRLDSGDYPVKYISWRGDYAEIALTYQEHPTGYTVEDWIKFTKEAIGQTFEGYKGGDFTMGKTTPVWVSNWSEPNTDGVSDVIQEEDGTVVLCTKIYEEY